MKYAKIEASRLPDNLRWDVPRQNQGQIVEVAYADERPGKYEAGVGSKYRRVTDTSDGRVGYAEREDA